DESGQAPAPIHILSGPDWPSGPPQPTLVTFVQRNGAWLIASLTAEPPEPTPTMPPPSPPRADPPVPKPTLAPPAAPAG
ncbi:MAG TPA: RNA polymerase subunit sigma-24, partial [Dehalococcoidia bacterium]